jgi:hypothetical protein
VNIPGATNKILDIPALTAANSGTYVLVATNIFGSGMSSPIEIDVVPMPPVVEIRIAEYDHSPSLTFPQLAAGTHASSRRRRRVHRRSLYNGGGMETPSTEKRRDHLLLTDLTQQDTGNYTLRVRNAYGVATSSAITIQVVVEPPYFALVPKVTKPRSESRRRCGRWREAVRP